MSPPDVLDVSVVVPTRDRPERVATLVARLAAVRSERVRAELIVVDDGSREPVAPILAGASAFGRPVTVLRQGRRGPATARNLGASAARGELLLFFADDLEPSAGWLDEHVRAHRERGVAPWAIVGPIEPLPGGGDTPFDRFTWRAGVHFDFAAAARELERYGNVSFARCYSSNLSLPRAAFDAASGFDEHFPGAAWEDVELGHRLHQRGVRIGLAAAASVRALPASGRSFGAYLRWRENALPSAQRALRLAPPLAALVARREPPRWRGRWQRAFGAAIALFDRLDRLGVPLPQALYRSLLGHYAPLAEPPDGAETPVRAGRIVRDPTTGAVRFDARGSDSVIAGELLLEALHPFRQRLSGRLLDLGCGDGPLRAPLQLAAEGYLGVDRSPRASAAAVRADAAALPFGAEQFDAVIVAEVLEHVRAPDAVLCEVHRVAAPGALVLVSAPFFYKVHDAPDDRWRFTEDGLRFLLHDAGFSIEQIRAVGGAGAVVADLVARNLATLPGAALMALGRGVRVRAIERVGGSLAHWASVAFQRAFLSARRIVLALATRHGETWWLTRFLWDRGSRMAKGYVFLVRKVTR